MKTSLFKSLYFQVLTAIAIGILLGHFGDAANLLI